MPEIGDIVLFVTKSGLEVPSVIIAIYEDGTADLDRTISGYDDVKYAMREGRKSGRWFERNT